MANTALRNSSMRLVREVHGIRALAEGDRLFRSNAVSLPVARDAVFVLRRILLFFAHLVVAREAGLHVALVPDDAAMRYLQMAVDTVEAHVEMLAMFRVNVCRRPNAFGQDIRQADGFAEVRVLYAVQFAELVSEKRHDALGSCLLVCRIGMTE